MSSKEFSGTFSPSKRPYKPQTDPLTYLIKDAFTLPQLFLLGAIAQIVIFATVPSRYALLPAALLLLHSISTIALQSASPSRNRFLDGVVPVRTSAQLPRPAYHPDPAAGKSLFGSQPAAEPVVVLHLGVQYNHPLGPLAPGAVDVTKSFLACAEELGRRAEEFGCISQSPWRAGERGSNNTLMTVFYFRSVEGLHAFAHDKVHREAWDSINRYFKETGHTHIGIFHETFLSMPGAYETIYVNMKPVLLGAANVKVHNEKSGDDEHVIPLVNADISSLRSQYGRMDRTSAGAPVQR